MAVFSTFMNALDSLAFPWKFMAMSLSWLPGTIFSLLYRGDFRTLLSPSRFLEAWFGRFWTVAGPRVKDHAEQRVIPLLEGRVGGGIVHDDVVNEPVSGVVLEVGAGSGMWADVFAKVNLSKGPAAPANEAHGNEEGELRQRKAAPGLTRVYGIEPNPASVAALRQRVKDIGLDGLYEAVPVGIESLNDPTAWAGRIEPGSVDCIVTVLCLCSIPEPEKNIKLLYECLKKGGRWYAYEHVRVSRGGFLLRWYQWLVDKPWSICLGGCRLCRNTEKTLREVGPWQSIDLVQPVAEPPYIPLPHILGTMTK